MSAVLKETAVGTTETLLSVGALDELIFSDDRVWALPIIQQQILRERFVREAFAHHMAHCPPYAQFVRRRLGLAQSAIASLELRDMPVIPTSAFKAGRILSVDEQAIAKWCLSSGTQGLRSHIGRDQATLERLMGSVRAGTTLISDAYEHEMQVLNLGPDKAEAGDVWFPYVMSLIELSYPTTSYMRQGHIDWAWVISDLAQLASGHDQVAITTPPAFLHELLSAMKTRERRLDFGDRLTIITAGGWKQKQGASIKRDALAQAAVSAFGMAAPHQVRDAFNQVELNTVLFECSAQRKHLPPWVAAFARSAFDLSAMPCGSTGLLSFLDASAHSYPAFIVGDDLGIVHDEECPCGVPGVTVSFVRRVAHRDARGCALSLQKQLTTI
jgi:long-chain-fatty-acid---luciferin-component ligase